MDLRPGKSLFALAPLALLAALSLFGATPATAADCVIAKQSEPQAIDPHFSRTGPNQHIAEHLFDRLIQPDNKDAMAPGLATSWRQIDDLTLEFKLRPKVKFHDGSEFTADDVLFSMARVPKVPNSPASYANDVKDVVEARAIDPLTVRFKAKAPNPLLLPQLGRIYIVSRKAAATATTQDFNSGKAAVGTGPYKFVSWTPGDKLVLQRNDAYWDVKPHFQQATLKFISNDAARVAALLSGSVDLIDAVPPNDFGTLRNNPKCALWGAPSPTLIYIHMDSSRDKTPFVQDKAGRPLDRNPFKDRRVRLALSKLIDRKMLVERVLYGSGEPAGQMVAKGLFGHNPGLKPIDYDLEGAKKLLAEAGYPNGFSLTLHSANDRYVFQSEVVQAAAQFLARGGIDIKVETMPTNVFMPRATKQEFSFFLLGFGVSTGDAMSGLIQVLATYDEKNNMGSNNRGRYSNPEFDKVIKGAMVQMDSARREKMVQQAAVIAFEDVGIIPLYFEKEHYATRRGLRYDIQPGIPRTNAMSLVPAQ
jgi:peptide/nickel transport system substrate-binding protein